MAKIIKEPKTMRALATRVLERFLRAFLAIMFSMAQSKVAARIINSPVPKVNFGKPNKTRLPPNRRSRANNCSLPTFSLRNGIASKATQIKSVL